MSLNRPGVRRSWPRTLLGYGNSLRGGTGNICPQTSTSWKLNESPFELETTWKHITFYIPFLQIVTAEYLYFPPKQAKVLSILHKKCHYENTMFSGQLILWGYFGHSEMAVLSYRTQTSSFVALLSLAPSSVGRIQSGKIVYMVNGKTSITVLACIYMDMGIMGI